MSQTKQTFTESGTFLINTGGQGVGPDGLALLFTETGTQSMVLKVNTAPPGATPSYTNIPYLNGSLVLQTAGTAITASGLVYVSAEYAALDLYGTLTATSGSLVVQVMAANLGNPEGAIPAADVTPGTFGANSGATAPQSYSFPTGVTINGNTTIDGTHYVTSVASPQTAVRYDSSNRLDLTVGATGAVTYNAVGASAQHVFPDPLNVGAAAGEATSGSKFIKAVTGIANNTATPLATVTVPNGAESAVIRLTVCGSLGAGGAIGANEASASNSYNLTITRTAGVAAVGAMSTAFGAAATAVAGAATCTSTLALSTVSGAVGATNTFTINGTIARSGGSSTNHTALLLVEVLNANATGITVA